MVLTGAYHSHAHVIDLQRRINTTINVQFMDKRGKQCGIPRSYKNKRLLGTVPINQQNAQPSSKSKSSQQPGNASKDAVMTDMSQSSASQASQQDGQGAGQAQNMTPSNDLKQRISIGTWHPKENTFAVAKHNSLFIYTEKRSISSSNDRKNRDREREREAAHHH